MIKSLQRIVRRTDAAVAGVYLSLFSERNALLGFLFHSLFRNAQEMELNQIDPLQRTTVAQFRQFIEYYLENGYQFISPDDLANGRQADGKYAMITFDDGYYNNTLALPILEEYGVPAVFFICSDNVQRNRCFWWDVHYRELAAQGIEGSTIYREGLAQKALRTHEIEERLIARFGAKAFTPRGDIDRPFSPSELHDFAAKRFVHIGNHSAGHAILTNYTPEDVRQQIVIAQEYLEKLTGKQPIAIAYPNGGYDAQIMRICREQGLKVGFTTRPRKNRLPMAVNAPELLSLSRFSLGGCKPIAAQCRSCRSDLQLYGSFRDRYVSMRGKLPA
jgi:peptidoglycan/xylan/chitin deacetylase (PgdA/CDA1 family)